MAQRIIVLVANDDERRYPRLAVFGQKYLFNLRNVAENVVDDRGGVSYYVGSQAIHSPCCQFYFASFSPETLPPTVKTVRR